MECPYCEGTGEMQGSDLHGDMTHCPVCDSYAKTGLWEADCGHAGCGNCIQSIETPQGEWTHCENCYGEGERCNECNDNYLWFNLGNEEVINDYNECDECNIEMCGTCDSDHNPCPTTGVYRAEGTPEKKDRQLELAEKRTLLSEKRTEYSSIRTGLSVTTFVLVLINLWVNKKQAGQIEDIMDLV